MLFRLNRMSRDIDPTQRSAAVYAYDPVTRTCALARARAGRAAGADPHRTGAARSSKAALEVLPLGDQGEPMETVEMVRLARQEVPAAFTDNLVESRDQDIDPRGSWLCAGCCRGEPRIWKMCDVTISSQRPGHERDDIALARVHELAPDGSPPARC